jgi:hypothetical protein
MLQLQPQKEEKKTIFLCLPDETGKRRQQSSNPSLAAVSNKIVN